MLSTAVAFVILANTLVSAAPTVNTKFPYKGPAVPIGDWVDQSVQGDGTGFRRLVEAPAVKPSSKSATNNINVVSLSYVPGGMHVHFQTPFGIDGEPCVDWGTDPSNLWTNTKGWTRTYDRTPPCSELPVTQCSQYFHEVSLWNLSPDTTYYYQIPGGNGTTPSEVMSFKTGKVAGDQGSFSVGIINDMGYTNAHGTHKQLMEAVDEGISFIWHGGDISYADDWYSGILPCQLSGEDSWPVCSNGTSTSLPGPAPIPDEYKVPLPAGEIPNQGGPLGGDMSVLYESNWDLWQQWMNNLTAKVPYMTTCGNHEASCAEFDGGQNVLSALLDEDIVNGTSAKDTLSYWSCPPSQRNFTAYQNRFRMPGDDMGGVNNFWYSFDYGLAHFISFDGETDFYQSPEYPFLADIKANETVADITEAETYPTDSGPFGYIDGNKWDDNESYEQIQWIKKDLESVDRSKTPWVFAMSHRPMYSSENATYELHMRNAFQDIFLEYGVDAYFSGHIHWFERLWPLMGNGTIDWNSVENNHTYHVSSGSMTHIINGAAGNVESHSTLDDYSGEHLLPITNYLNYVDYGMTKMTVYNATTLMLEYIRGTDGSVADYLWLKKDW